ncbi:hypothetical protein [Micromonospora deserti]|uniref:Thioredoxin-like fold domain-containing protein n=1 Tax=Micromonospora deserti TaxID=2070366 RepID=A0A2W2CRS2_9ACTN|nr:hypothetical protein [Micromonospora deserti]PZG02226.1 hypothetical protein C1I99_03750 [Micromonospora deserti]
MSAEAAIAGVTWVALIVLYLGLAATLRDVRLLRNELAELKSGAVRPQAIDITLPGFAPATGAERVVLVADAGCPACQDAAETLAEAASSLSVRPALLTYEPADEWAHVGDRVDVARDGDAWAQLSHLNPPILLLVGPGGAVREMALLVNGQNVPTTLSAWGVRQVSERI